jgi:hypothetical protein
MDIIETNTTSYIYCNISNESSNSKKLFTAYKLRVINDGGIMENESCFYMNSYTMTIETAEYDVNVTLDEPVDANGRYVTFKITEGIEDLANATINLPNNGDYPYKITNSSTYLDNNSSMEVHRGILRLKQPKEVVYSYTNEQTTIIYE